jgi:hypothetical protein
MSNNIFFTFLLAFIPLVSFAQECTVGDCENGYGVFEYADGKRYIGEFEQGKRNGEGVLFLVDNTKYVGSWQDDVLNGEGRFYYDGFLVKAGFWENGIMVRNIKSKSYCASGNCVNGFGISVLEDGRKIIGEFEDGEIKNHVICYYPNGDKYIGQWKFQTRNGNGLLKSFDQEQDGIWIDGSFVGVTRGVQQEGCVFGNCKNGEGKIIYSNKTVYDGHFVNGLADGFGVCYYADGDIYSGQWKKHKSHGEGIMYYSNGQVIRGFWAEGSYLGKVQNKREDKIQDSEGKVYAVLVGVARYDYMRSLKYTDDDAYRLNAFLRSPEGGALPDEQIEVLIDESASRNEILNRLEGVAAKATKNDVIIFYFSGHGLEGSFLPNDYDGADYVVKHQTVKDILESSDAKAKIVIADACHSGSFLAARSGNYEAIVNTYYSAFKESKGGFALMLSSKGEESSIESNGLRQGIFSHYLIKGLSGAANTNADEIVTIDELFFYVYNNVRFYTNKSQTPIIIGEFDRNMPMSVIRK